MGTLISDPDVELFLSKQPHNSLDISGIDLADMLKNQRALRNHPLRANDIDHLTLCFRPIAAATLS